MFAQCSTAVPIDGRVNDPYREIVHDWRYTDNLNFGGGQFGRTMAGWRHQIAAWHHARVSNGPTERRQQSHQAGEACRLRLRLVPRLPGPSPALRRTLQPHWDLLGTISRVARGNRTPGSHRTGCEPLRSSGSCRSAWSDRDKEPIGEESGVLLSCSVYPDPRFEWLPPQSLGFLHGPSDQMLV